MSTQWFPYPSMAKRPSLKVRSAYGMCQLYNGKPSSLNTAKLCELPTG